MSDDRLLAQLAFLMEADRLKLVERRSAVAGGVRRENSAEHSWHLALFALVLAERAAEPVDLLRVLTMLLLHDVVEIDAGDTYVYDTAGRETQEAREAAAADRLFALLPPDQAEGLRAAWDEFEAAHTAEARFAAALDRLQPLLLNHAAQGRSWRDNDVHAGQVLARSEGIRMGSVDLWALAREVVDDAVGKGYLAPPAPSA